MDQTDRKKAPTDLLSDVERETILKKMTASIMALIESFSLADTPTSQFQMFRKTTLGEVYSVFYGKVHTLPSNPRRETWFSTSLNHPRLFLNAANKDIRKDTVLMVYHFDFECFQSEFQDRIIHQEHAKGFDNKNAETANLKNYVHRELLEKDRMQGKGKNGKKGSINHPWTKFNFALVGKENHERFNKCIEKAEVCDMMLQEDTGFTSDQIGFCRPLEIGVGLKQEQPQQLSNLGTDGYRVDGTMKSVTSKVSSQPQTKYDKNCDAISNNLPPKQSNENQMKEEDDDKDKYVLPNLFDDDIFGCTIAN